MRADQIVKQSWDVVDLMASFDESADVGHQILAAQMLQMNRIANALERLERRVASVTTEVNTAAINVRSKP